MAIAYFHAYSLNLFGNTLEYGANISLPGLNTKGYYYYYYYYLDNGFADYILRNGLIAFIFILSYIVITIEKLIVNKKWNMLIIFTSYVVYATVETNLFTLTCNIFLLLLGIIIQNEAQIEKVR